MKNVKLSKLWDTLRSSYWFLPGLMAVASMVLAFSMLALDQADTVKTGELSWIYRGGPEGARGLLSAVASSMVTVAATAFSITIVALQLAASNFGPRLLRNFMQDTGNQLVLGTFIATFLYCLLVLRTIHGEDYNLFVPQLSVTIGIVLAVASIGVLIYFIHHASTIIQASHVIAGVAEELDEVIDRLFPEEMGQSKLGEDQQITLPKDFDVQTCPIKSLHDGYLQIIDDQLLLKLAVQHNLLLCLKLKPGEFVVQGKPLLLAYPGERMNSKLVNQVNQAFVLGKERTETQDIEFPINQLVEIALRALSPGINDPFTAIRCIDRLGAALTKLVQRPIPSAYRYDNTFKLRVIAAPVSFETLVDSAFSQIRRYAASDVAVTIRLLQAIALVISYTNSFKYLSVLRAQADKVVQSSCDQLSEECDRQFIEKQYRTILETLEERKSLINQEG